MEVVLDLHLHSRYSRAVSQNMTFPVMHRLAKQKGLDVLSACDFTHPLWLKEMHAHFEEAAEGLYRVKNQPTVGKDVLFLLSTEIASIYSQGGKLRRIHNLVFAPSLAVVAKVNEALLKRGANLTADGRPIIGLSSKNLLSLLLEIDERCMMIPAHIWTPHFGVYGSASGFDSLAEAFEELAPYIYGIETGLSSDPEMNWQIAELNTRSILSFSDAHSPAKMGREATILITKQEGITDITYEDIRRAIMRKSERYRVGYSIEFYPEEGKYHFSGHRNCNVVYGPEDIAAKGNLCPTCGRKLTEGVLFRVQQLADQADAQRVKVKRNEAGLKWYTDQKRIHPPFMKLVPLNEIVAESMHATVAAQKVKNCFELLCESFGSELHVLLKAALTDIEKIAGEQVARTIDLVRRGDIVIDPGYDGVYGKVTIAPEEKKAEQKEETTEAEKEQMGLF